MSTSILRKNMHCYNACCDRCNTRIERPGHNIQIEYHATSDTVVVLLDGDMIACMSDDIWEAICKLDQHGEEDEALT